MSHHDSCVNELMHASRDEALLYQQAIENETLGLALLRQISSYSDSTNDCSGEVRHLCPSQHSSFSLDSGSEMYVQLQQLSSFPAHQELEPISSTLDEYYKNQESINQVYVNNAIAASTVAASAISTASYHIGSDVPALSSATLPLVGGLAIDLQHHNQTIPNIEAQNGRRISYNIDDVATDTAIDDIYATAKASYASADQQQHLSQQICPNHSSLFLPSDSNFISEAHCFIRSVCIEIFSATGQDLIARGGGERPFHVGQVGIRCIHCKNKSRKDQAKHAVAFPYNRDSIFESIQQFKREHMHSCPFIPSEIKRTFREIISKGRNSPKRPHKLVRAYYAQAASEVGLIDTPFGLSYGDVCGCKQRSTPSRAMLNLLEAAQTEESMKAIHFDQMFSPKNDYTLSSTSDQYHTTKDIRFGKFESLSSKLTKQVILNARKEFNVFVEPPDFPTISDFVFLLFHQLKPCKPVSQKMRIEPLAGFCCKHCQKEGNDNSSGVYFPSNVESLADSSFSQTFLTHLMHNCEHVSQDIKHALTELKNLAREYKASVKRGGKKKFIGKVWQRLEEYSRKTNVSVGTACIAECPNF